MPWPAGDKDHFANLAVNAIMRLKGSGNLEAIHVIKKTGGTLHESFLDEVRAGVGGGTLHESFLDEMGGGVWGVGNSECIELGA